MRKKKENQWFYKFLCGFLFLSGFLKLSVVLKEEFIFFLFGARKQFTGLRKISGLWNITVVYGILQWFMEYYSGFLLFSGFLKLSVVLIEEFKFSLFGAKTQFTGFRKISGLWNITVVF